MARTLSRTALIVAAKGGLVRDITAGDVLELLDTEAGTHASSTGDTAVFYRLLRLAGSFDPGAPETLRALRTTGQRTPEAMIDRYHLACRPVRDLLVDYLRERQPAVDYITLESLARSLGRDFWQDLERHHPGIGTLQLPPEVASSWKQRRRTKPKTVTDTGTGEKTAVAVPRLNYRECLTRVRAFYLDIAQWAAEDPARWGAWVARCPVSAAEINQRKAARHRKSRMDARTRERLPVLPALVQAVSQRRKAADALLLAARDTPPGQAFSAAGQTLTRSVTLHATSTKVWADDPATSQRRDLTLEEDHAFWSWAIVEVLRATGIRIEELLEVTHYSLVQYRLPTTGELVPLLQIAPSKTDTERLLVVSPDMADVLSAIISRLRSQRHGGAVPLVPAYDSQERTWLPPSPVLFQRRFGSENRRISAGAVRDMLNAALAGTGLAAADGSPLRCTPHDFRRIFITDAIMSGLPPHIAQIIAGHRDINVTLGYKAVYPDEAIQAHLAFLARRRALRPGEEYRVPTDEEWQEFLGISSGERSPPAPAGERSEPHVFTSIVVCVAACTGHRPTSATALPRSATTSSPASPKPNAKAGSARSKGSRSASPEPATSSPRSAGACRQIPRSASACPSSPISLPPQGAPMTPAPVTDSLLHDLVASSQAEGTSQFAVAAAITLDDRVLLCGRTTPDFDQEWDLPGGPALPGETLAGALDRTLACDYGLEHR